MATWTGVQAGSVLAVQLVDYLNLAPGDTGICNGLFSQSSQVGWVGVGMLQMREAVGQCRSCSRLLFSHPHGVG